MALKEVTYAELIDQFCRIREDDSEGDLARKRAAYKEALDQLAKNVKATEATHLVLFRNQDMWASQMGATSLLCVGPNCTYKTPEGCEGHHLHDLPSQRQYPQAFCKVPA